MKDKLPLGIKVFGVLLIFISLIQLRHLSNIDYYWWLFNPMPENLIGIRWFFSIITRIIELIAGIGILCRKDVFRKIALGLFVAIIFATYWKHPYFAVHKYSLIVANNFFTQFNITEFITPALNRTIAMLSMLSLYISDIAFSVFFIYYFTRPKIKQWFS